MKPCAYYAPERIEELLNILADNEGKAKVIAGGTDYVIGMQEGKINTKNIVALHKIQELKGIHMRGDTLVLGAMTTFTELVKSPLIREKAFVLAQAASMVGSPQIRNMGTVGGNIANASPAADTVPAMVALDARVKLISPSGEREMLLENFFAGIGKTKLATSEIIQEIAFPALNARTGSAFAKLGRRNALAISRVSVAAIVGYAEEDDVIIDFRIAVGSVAPSPFRVRSAERTMLNCSINNDKRCNCVEAAMEEISVTLGQRASAIYKKKAAPTIIRNAIDEAIAQICCGWEKTL